MALPTKGQDGSVRFGELFVFPRPTGGGTPVIISVVGTHPLERDSLVISFFMC